jgi:hypothetical protein
MASGLFLDRRTDVSNFGIRRLRLCSACCKVTRILVRALYPVLRPLSALRRFDTHSILFFCFFLLNMFSRPVISINVNPMQPLLATGSGDQLARVCE